jgi:hypothetical protein
MSPICPPNNENCCKLLVADISRDNVSKSQHDAVTYLNLTSVVMTCHIYT